MQQSEQTTTLHGLSCCCFHCHCSGAIKNLVLLYGGTTPPDIGAYFDGIPPLPEIQVANFQVLGGSIETNVVQYSKMENISITDPASCIRQVRWYHVSDR